LERRGKEGKVSLESLMGKGLEAWPLVSTNSMKAYTVYEASVMRKVTLRIIPYTSFLYLLCTIDRTNIGNAHERLMHDLNITESQYANAVAIFFLGYCLCEIPSNLALKKSSANRWIARIMVSWGIITACTSLVSSYAGLMVVRFLLGAAEAGFFPGMIYYFTFWFNKHERAQKIAQFYVTSLVGGVIGGISSYFILDHLDDKADLKGWQWLYILQGAPTILAGITVWFLLPNSPQDVKWLTAEEKSFVITRLDNPDESSATKISWKEAIYTFIDPQVLGTSFIALTCISTIYTIAFFMPALITEFRVDQLLSNLLTAPVYAVGAVFLLIHSYVADRTGEYLLVVAFAAIFSTVGWLALSASLIYNWNVFGQYAIIVMLVGFSYAQLPSIFAQLSSGLNTSTRAATGTAIAVSIGNIGGYIGPKLMGESKDRWDTYAYAVGALSAFSLLTAIGALVLRAYGRPGGYKEIP